MLPQTEQDHLRALLDALGQAQNAASLRGQSDLTAYLHAATAQATALGYYRNQSSWNQIAILLDHVAKCPISNDNWPQVAAMLGELRRKVRVLANRGTH